ncbi:hypothetical protein E4T56_gene9787 [Termitomyces sp. T112]|nr:hypothetical protein E4T56_gene9787 [Termitomyces sp. T112]
MGPRVPRPPFFTNHPCPPLAPMPNPPADANYFGPPTPRGPPRWAPGPAPGNVAQTPSGGPPNGRPPEGWGPVMDNFPPQRRNGNNYYYYYNAGPLPQAQNPQDNTHNALAQKVYGKRVGGLGLEDALHCRPDPDVFSAPATLLHATILALDSPPVHLLSHSSTNLLLHTTHPFTDNPIPTLVNSSATNNFIDESLAVLTPHPLRHLPTSIPLKLFDGDPTPAGDITHCLETTMTFANGRQQELQLLITKLHPSTSDNPTDSGLVPFNVSPSSENSETTIDPPPWTPPQLRSRSAWLFIINVQLNDSSKVFPALINSSASGTFISNQLGLWRNNLDKSLELQLFDGSPATTRISQYHDNTLTLDNDLQFQAWLLITQLPPPTPIVLGLPWLQDINSNINWKNLTMQFPSPENQYKGLRYPNQQHSKPLTNSATTPDSSATTLTSNSVDSGNLDIKIIGTVPFAHLLHDSTPAFQLQIMPALPKEHLHTGTTVLESKMEEQILSKVVPLEYHEFANMFSEGSAKELPLHHSYDHKIDLKEGTSPPFGKIYNMSEIKL